MPAAIVKFLLVALPVAGVAAIAAAKDAGASPNKKTSGTFTLDEHLPEQVEEQALAAIRSEKVPAKLEALAAQLDNEGHHLTAAALRQRAAELSSEGAPSTPAAAPVSAPGATIVPPAPAAAAVTPGGIGALDPGLDAETRQAIVAALTSEQDPARLEGLAERLADHAPVSAGLLWSKAAALKAAAPVGALVPAALSAPAPYAAPAPAPAYGPPPGPAPIAATPVVTDGHAQAVLNALGYVGADNAPLKVDGIVGPNTQFALRAFQSDHGLPTTGRPDQTTKTALAAAIAQRGILVPAPIVHPLHATAPVAAPPPAGVVMTNSQIQESLNSLGYFGPDEQPLKVDGLIGPKSLFAVKRFQQHAGLVVDGRPGPLTKAALVDALRAQTQSPAALYHPAAAAPATVPAVAHPQARGVVPIVTNQQVQAALNALGFKGADGRPLKVDGAIGPNSQAAVRAFQNASGLKADAIPGQITKSALAAAIAAKGLSVAA
jgi:peptidoglycan hydrolase-like protein with peptidoglycan-binding domain